MLVVEPGSTLSTPPEIPTPDLEHFSATAVVHKIYVQGHVYLVLSDAEWYDTAYCAAQLDKLSRPQRSAAERESLGREARERCGLLKLDALVATTPVQIESFGEIHLIDGPDALLGWVERVFECSYPQGFGHMLRGRHAKNSGE